MIRLVPRRTSDARSARAQAAFIGVGVIASIMIASFAVGALFAVISIPGALFAAGAIAAWWFSVIRLLDLVAASESISLDCRDGVHDGCLICSCTCHQEP
ncbi:hypothetical protein ACYX8G_19520 [Microbacterium saperdae]